MSKQIVDPTLTEEDRVFIWRYQQLLAAGLDDFSATAIGESCFDLHQALRMLEDGCPPDLLVEIIA